MISLSQSVSYCADAIKSNADCVSLITTSSVIIRTMSFFDLIFRISCYSPVQVILLSICTIMLDFTEFPFLNAYPKTRLRINIETNVKLDKFVVRTSLKNYPGNVHQ